MQKYLGVKIIEAIPMTAEFASEELNRYVNTANAEQDDNGLHPGYLVKYPDGYISWSPKKQFEEAYRPTGGLTFGLAIEAMRMGKKVARAGWNGKNMWIVMMPPLYLPPHSHQEPGAKVNDRTAKHIGVDTPLDSQAYFAMWTAAKQWQPGWLANQADMLAEDWMIVE